MHKLILVYDLFFRGKGTLMTDINVRSGINVRVGNFGGNNKLAVHINHTGMKIMGEMNEKIAFFAFI